eukprot:scaffold9753_cov35-Attheya_sp.AAC.1
MLASMMILADFRARMRLSFISSWDSLEPSRSLLKLDLRTQPAAEVLSVIARMQDSEVRRPSRTSIQMPMMTARNSSILMLSRPSHGMGVAQRQSCPSAE